MVELKNGSLRAGLALRGGHIEYLRNDSTGASHCWDYNAAVWPRRTSVCFPVCGALHKNQYDFGGSSYPMPQHGFARGQNFTVEDKSPCHAVLALRANSETRELYPFDFELKIHYQLEPDRLEIRYEVENTSASEPMYFSFGNHFAYSVPVMPGEDASDYRLVFPRTVTGLRYSTRDGLLDGAGLPVSLQKETPVAIVDSRAVVLPCDEAAVTEIILANPRSGASTVVSFSGFDRCLLWAPYSGADFVCIEPWAGITGQWGEDPPLERKPGIVLLAPRKRRQFLLSIGNGNFLRRGAIDV